MSERSVKVRLWASTTEYEAAMKRAKGATSDMASGAGRDFQKLGSQMSDVGRTMTAGVTLPMVGVAAGAVKMAAGFDSSMAKIQALVGLSADEVDGMRDSVMGLAGETATAPQELADALFVVTSAGLRGGDAMDALEMAAKASAAGLGETNDIARAVAGTMNAYGSDVISASEATDILTATARAGNFETSQLAGALGRVLPFAKQAEASFEDVGGAVALLTRTNGNAAESITQIQALMRGFVVPTAEAVTILGELGMSAEDVRTSIGEQGLVATLQMLDDKLGGNREQLGRLLGSSEAASAAFQILEADAQTITDTFGVTANAVGMTNEAFGTMSETAGFKMKQAWVDLQTSMITVGDILLPFVSSLADGVAGLAKAFDALPGPAQKAVVAFGALAAATGPALMVGGSLIRNYQQVSDTWTKMGPASRVAVGAIGVAAVAFAAYQIHAQRAAQNTQNVIDAADELARVADEQLGQVLTNAIMSGVLAGQSLDEIMSTLARTNIEGAKRMLDHAEATGVTGEATDALRDAIVKEEAARKQQTATTDKYADAEVGASKATDMMREAIASATEAGGIQESVLDAVSGALEKNQAELERNAEAEAALQAQVERSADAQRVNADRINRAREAHERYVDSILNSLSTLFSHEEAVLKTENAYLAYTDAVWANVEAQADGELSDRDKIKSANDLRLQELALAGQAYDTAEAFAEEAGAVQGSKAWADRMTESLQAQAAQYPELRDEIQMMIDKLNAIPTVIHTGVTITWTENGRPKTIGSGVTGGTISTSGRRAAGGPTYAGNNYEVLEEGKSELLHENGKTFLMSANDGYVTPLTGLVGASNPGGNYSSVNNTYNIEVVAPAGSNADEFARKVWQALERESRWRGPIIRSA